LIPYIAVNTVRHPPWNIRGTFFLWPGSGEPMSLYVPRCEWLYYATLSTFYVNLSKRIYKYVTFLILLCLAVIFIHTIFFTPYLTSFIPTSEDKPLTIRVFFTFFFTFIRNLHTISPTFYNMVFRKQRINYSN